MMKGIQTLYFICFLLLLISCSSTKYVGEGEYLLDKVEIVSDGKTYKNSDLKPYLRQQPNFKAFGLMKWQLFVYSHPLHHPAVLCSKTVKAGYQARGNHPGYYLRRNHHAGNHTGNAGTRDLFRRCLQNHRCTECTPPAQQHS